MLKNYPGIADPLTPSRITLGSPTPFLPQHPVLGRAIILTSVQES